ncbi:MAG: D-glycero-beta-D-manno-heptose 1-phosphate adenylyltransferase [Desulfotignum sp.]|nr:D-glycero-beta-D-manno-heptose 1-phosphate adenylyltransferase [Desulfotignum sp.]
MIKSMNKLLSLKDMELKAAQFRAAGRTIVFTNGCFDILHAGHVSYLAAAAGLGDVLVLGLNSDLSVKKIKGDKRPVISQAHRARVVAALQMVDHVVLFDEPDPETLIRAVCPDVLVKGADWSEDAIAGAGFVRAGGGKVVRIDLEPGISTTSIIRRIGALYYGAGS